MLHNFLRNLKHQARSGLALMFSNRFIIFHKLMVRFRHIKSLCAKLARLVLLKAAQTNVQQTLCYLPQNVALIDSAYTRAALSPHQVRPHLSKVFSTARPGFFTLDVDSPAISGRLAPRPKA